MLGLARLVFRLQGHDDLSLFARTLIYQRRKNLEEMREIRLPDHIKWAESGHFEDVPPAIIKWGNRCYGLSRYYHHYSDGEWVDTDFRRGQSGAPFISLTWLDTWSHIFTRLIYRSRHSLTWNNLEIYHQLERYQLNYSIISSIISLASPSPHCKCAAKFSLSKSTRTNASGKTNSSPAVLESCLILMNSTKQRQREPLEPGSEWDWRGLVAYFAHPKKNFLDDKLWNTSWLLNICEIVVVCGG